MGRIIDGMHGGLQSIQGFADRRDSKKKVTALYALTAFIIVLSAVSAVWMLVQLKFLSCAFDLAVAGLGIMGFHATRHRHRSLLLLFVVGMAVLVGLGLLGLALSIVYSVFSLSLELIYLTVQLFLIAIEGLALILAYSLSKDLDPKRMTTMGAPHDGSAMEAGEQVFTFEDDGHMHHAPGAMMVNAPAPVYHQQPTTTPLGGIMPVYDPATGTYGGYPGQPMYNPYAPQMAVYPPSQQQPYAYPPHAVPYGSQQLPSVSPAPSVAAPAGDVFDFAQPSAAAAQGTYTIDDDDDEFDPFHEQPSAH